MTQTPLHRWREAIGEIKGGRLECRREAAPEERSAIVGELGLVWLDALAASYAIRRLGDGVFQLRGRLTAELAQPCVVSLEPVATRIDAAFDVEYRSGGGVDPGGSAEDELEALSAPEIEPIVAGTIDVGRIVFESLAAALPPYPRRPDALYKTESNQISGSETTHPFAVLRPLVRKS